MMFIRGSLEQAVRALKGENTRLKQQVGNLQLRVNQLEGQNDELFKVVSGMTATEVSARLEAANG